MREISTSTIEKEVAQLCENAGCDLPEDVKRLINEGREKEESPFGKYAFDLICNNIEIADRDHVPLCQDTGLALIFVDIGQDVHVVGGDLNEAINRGVAEGYTNGYLRKSVVKDPLFHRDNTGDNTPGFVYTRIVPGDKIKISVMPKGAGSENMCALKMLKPAQGLDGVLDFVTDAVVSAGGNPCPPSIVGVGIGSDAEGALLLSKRAVLREAGAHNPDKEYAQLEDTLLKRINDSGVGPMGFGGRVTALAVQVEAAPTHIAMLPVGVTISCHCTRHTTAIL